jgi:hypothetical protein
MRGVTRVDNGEIIQDHHGGCYEFD